LGWRYLDLVDFLLIAEAVLDLPAEDLARAARVDMAESALHAPAAEFGGVEFYADLASKAAVLASRIIRNHPLPDGNKRVGYLCALEFVARNGGYWAPPAADDPDGDETVAIIEGVAAGRIDEEQLRAWVAERLGGRPLD
jgi:death on curing protein